MTTLNPFPNRSVKRRPEGQSAVEMALLLPVLLLVIFGIIISAFMFYAYVQVSNAAREGARAGSLYRITQVETGPLLATVRNAIYDPVAEESALGYLPTTPPSFDVSKDVTFSLTRADGGAADPSDPQPGDRLTVNVIYSYTLPIVSVLLPMFPQPIVIQRNVMMEIQ